MESQQSQRHDEVLQARHNLKDIPQRCHNNRGGHMMNESGDHMMGGWVRRSYDGWVGQEVI